ncbi:tannase/feruloyl esterase family alpha/beta hydrolase [Shewanella spartinae]|uniref:tannase/feruloyl esterase family alpha/beta hydrolase n=1 Tax=Shewanella spartinae TaxID=2864205 RepID=UPI001C6606A7|nr:tannase/feruloyl esterase family alpha/beta hydrolase [Shewanella spartinae]QYJ92765.1 tannase/feruloyl esterase family alpha/beta hydrolase [Shewanella spartinae]
MFVNLKNLPVSAMSLLALAVLAGCNSADTPQAPQITQAAEQSGVTQLSNDAKHQFSLGECSVEAMPILHNVRYTQVERTDTHCLVSGVIEREINFTVSLPDDWNGMFAQSGGGGFVGSVVDVIHLATSDKGYATAGTDSGHRAHALESNWAANTPYREERLTNFGGRATHLTTQNAKLLIQHYYQQESQRNLFFGCSRGGGEGLIAAQRYPTDYDVIVAGSPAYDYAVSAGALHAAIARKMFPDPNNLDHAIVGDKEIELVNRAVAQQCSNRDGLDANVLSEPWNCQLDLKVLQCSASNNEACLTPEQVEVFDLVFNGLYDSQGNLIAEGFYPGAGVAMFNKWLAGGLAVNDLSQFQSGVQIDPDMQPPLTPSFGYAFGNGIMSNFVFDGEYDAASYNFDNIREDGQWVTNNISATSPDLAAFRKQGGKLIIWNGLHDMAVTPASTRSYYQEVIKHDPKAAEDVALFLLPGMDHCAGGAGPWMVDWMAEANQWLDSQEKPQEMVAHWFTPGQGVTGNRKICAYPQVAVWDGKGDDRSAASFRCELPDDKPKSH